MAAAVGMIAGCQKPEMVQIAAPEDVVAPVLEAVEGPVEITPSNMVDGVVAFNWSAADYGVPTQINYSLEAAKTAAPDALVTITSGITTTSAEVDYETLNAILFNDLKLADGVAEDVNFCIGVKVGEYAKIYSNVITVSCKVTAAEKTYPMIYMPGSYQDWKPDQAAVKFQVLYDFAGNGVFEGIADFGKSNDADRAWKFTPEPDWDFDWGIPSGETPAAEAAEITLINNDGGDRSDIKVYTVNRYYHFSMDTNTGLLKKNYSFDQIGVIGSFNGWGGDVVMEFNAAKRRFYADVEFAEDGQFKLRADADWAVNWGADAFGMTVSNGDGNLEAKAGNYRVYAYMSNPAEMTIELVAGMYGKEEPTAGTTTPEPEPTPELKGWGIVGTITGWADGADIMMISDGTWHVAKGVEFGAEDKFKIRLDGKWDTSFGGEFKANEEVTLTSENGPDIVPAAGKYDIYFNPENGKAWFINDGSYPGGGAAPEASPWALIGEFNSWGGDYPMVIDGEYHKAVGFVQAADGKLKFRKDGMWNYKDDEGNEIQTNFGGTFAADAEVALTPGGSDIIVPAGTYDIYLKVAEDGQSGFAYFMTPGKTPADAGEAVVIYIDPSAESFVVGFSGSALGWDDPAFDTNDRATFVSKNVTDAATYSGTYEFKLEGLSIAAEDQFKVRINGQWIGDGGAVVEGLAVTAASDGNFIAGEAGTYTAVITFAWDGSTHSDVKVVFSK